MYICSGCGIEKSLDLEALSDIAAKEYSVTCCKKHPFFCSREGIHLIQKDIENEKLNGVVICACSPRVNTWHFSFDSKVIIERVNIREQVIWCHTPNDEETQMLAEDNLRMGIVKANSINLPVPFIGDDLSSDILVIGGGITGITSAIEGAKAGYKIILIEKEVNLGGWANELLKQTPQLTPFQELEDPIIYKRIPEIEKYSNIEVLTSAEIKEISGQPGMFDVVLFHQGKEKKYKIATIVMATGWKPYDPTKLSEYGYGKFKNVITNIEMERLAKDRKLVRPSDKKKVENVLFVQCAGSRNEKHLPYCSAYCCGTTLKQAKYIRDLNQNSSVFIIYKDIRIPGLLENFYKEIQNDDGIFLTKGEIGEIAEKNDDLVVEVRNTLFDEDIIIKVDMVVLAMGMIPANSEELNLKYRLGKGLPPLIYDFPDSHFICFPYETRRTGIYAAGTLRAPMDMSECMDDARGAVLKAIQCIECLKRGEAVHPRSGDQSYPDLFLDRCTDCKRCTEECPFGSYDETEKGTPILNPNRCRRCGICLGSCPERIINFSDFSINNISSMIKAIKIPEEEEEKPRVLLFVCENDAYPAFDMIGLKRLKYSPFVRIIPVRCIGSVNNVWISDALSHGFDGIMQIGCKPGDDYQCHFIQGSELTEIRGENIRETLEKMMLEPERIKTEFVEITDYEKIPEIIDGYIKIINKIGPNPFKSL